MVRLRDAVREVSPRTNILIAQILVALMLQNAKCFFFLAQRIIRAFCGIPSRTGTLSLLSLSVAGSVVACMLKLRGATLTVT